MSIEGIDVSHNNGVIDWAKVAASGRRFAFIKATQGASYTDPQFNHNWLGAGAHKIAVSPYHFYEYDASWSDQAHHFVTTVGTLGAGELPPMLDLEQDTFRKGLTRVSVADATRQTLAWLDAVHGKFGVPPIIYADRDFVHHFLQDKGFAKYPLYLAALTPKAPAMCAPWNKPTFWQYSWSGACPGVSGPCDLDRFLGTHAAEFKALLKA